MTDLRSLVALSVLVIVVPGFARAQEEEPEADPDINLLGVYLAHMGDKLNCYFTFEDRPDPETGSSPWLMHLGGFEPDLDVATIDALVAKLDTELEGVNVTRNTKYPRVVHLIAMDLLVQDDLEELLDHGYVMEETVTTEYSGLLDKLPDHLGTLLEGRIHTALPGFAIPIRIPRDMETEVEVDVQDETVRNILTGPVPLVPERRFLWESFRYEEAGLAKVDIIYYVAIKEDEEPEE